MEEARPIEKGYWMALTTTPHSGPSLTYVGQVQAIDEHGIRLTLIDWPTRTAAGHDLFVSWKNLRASLIGTAKHDVNLFLESAEQWQEIIDNNIIDNKH